MSVVLITGSSIGMGLSTAIHLANKGPKVYATMRNPSKASFSSAGNVERLAIATLSLDVNSDVSVTEAVKQVMDKDGFINVLINNAGVSALGAVEELPLESFKKDMEPITLEPYDV
jgi:NAD(P)-dependent dehydrogenase (short-subunit alcohol dehydrogenase family)